MNCFEYSV